MDQKQQNVNLKYLTPSVNTDGNIVMISDKGIPSLLFFQSRDQHEGHMHADVVAAVRLNNIDELKGLAKAINDTVRQHQTREP